MAKSAKPNIHKKGILATIPRITTIAVTIIVIKETPIITNLSIAGFLSFLARLCVVVFVEDLDFIA